MKRIWLPAVLSFVVSLLVIPAPLAVAQGSTNLAVTKTASPEPVLVGKTLTYTVTVTNNGPHDVRAPDSVTLVDVLPATVKFESVTATQGTCVSAAPTVTCALGQLDEGNSATVTILVRPLQPGTITNMATATNLGGDPFPADNTATATSTVETPACQNRPPQARGQPPFCS